MCFFKVLPDRATTALRTHVDAEFGKRIHLPLLLCRHLTDGVWWYPRCRCRRRRRRRRPQRRGADINRRLLHRDRAAVSVGLVQ